MKTKMDDLFQYDIWLDKEDMERLREKGSITVDSHLEVPGVPFIHIILDKELRDEE